MKITVYTTTTCPYCEMLMDYLDSKKINYVKKLVDEDESAKKEMMETSEGFLGVPYTVIESEGEITKVIGFDQKLLEETLNPLS